MQNLFDRRRYRRLPIKLSIEINKLYKQNYDIIELPQADITVFDISKDGIGFISDTKLPLGYYFDSVIELDPQDSFRAVVKIVRIVEQEGIEGKIYGAQFVGLAPFLAAKIDDYERNITQTPGEDMMHYDF